MSETSDSKRIKTAVIDGFGDSAEVHLCWCDADDDVVEEIKWPDDWPEYVTFEFLKNNGFTIVNA